jgi:hypothetical protein
MIKTILDNSPGYFNRYRHLFFWNSLKNYKQTEGK